MYASQEATEIAQLLNAQTEKSARILTINCINIKRQHSTFTVDTIRCASMFTECQVTLT